LSTVKKVESTTLAQPFCVNQAVGDVQRRLHAQFVVRKAPHGNTAETCADQQTRDNAWRMHAVCICLHGAPYISALQSCHQIAGWLTGIAIACQYIGPRFDSSVALYFFGIFVPFKFAFNVTFHS